MLSMLVLLISAVAIEGSAVKRIEKGVNLRKIAEFPFNNPAFVTAVRNPLNNGSFDMLISTFGVSLPFKKSPDGVWMVEDIGTKLFKAKRGSSVSLDAQLLGDRQLTWPNEVELTEDGQLVAAGGFLVPGKKGHVSVLDLKQFKSGKSAQWKELIGNDKGFFHRSSVVQIAPPSLSGSDDGKRLVTCRGRKGIFDGGSGEMIYLDKKSDGSYVEHLIAPGCDCFFVPIDLNGDGVMEFIIPEFFGKKLILQWTEDPQGDWTKTDLVRQRVVDDTLGAAFDITVADLFNDGNLQLVVGNHQDGKKGPKPQMFAYDVIKPAASDQIVFESGSPISNYMNGLVFERHVLSDKFKLRASIFNPSPGAPGSQVVFKPLKSQQRPYILISGDDDQRAHLLVPRNCGKKWSYDHVEIHDCKGTVGGVFVNDLDGNGRADVIIPCYGSNTIAVYEFEGA
ncbi:hypothetical protein MIR68_001692 [Amoeboaphelidium protococcarum]|nr:hypothetical protein MIR68_001692 [Amoeboaphelidium protococcarum]